MIQRLDKYTILVDGYEIRATPMQEMAIKAMSDGERERFLKVMGKI